MNINFTGKYKSINDFTWNDVPDFVVLTGLNGAGKSQLLEIISFVTNQQNMKNNGNNGTVSVTYPEILNVGDVRLVKLENLVPNNGTSVSGNELENYKRQAMEQFRSQGANGINENTFQGVYKKIFFFVAKKSGKTITAITEDDILKHYPLYIEMNVDDAFQQNFATLFYKYQQKKIFNELAIFMHEKYGVDKEYLTPQEFIEQYGEEPWKVVNNILEQANLDYRVNHPTEEEPNTPFTLILRHKDSGEIINFTDLSSGEKVIMSFVFLLYNATLGVQDFPKILLLDEPDGPLHPSMTKQFLDVITNVLVKDKGVKVIMTTHSPSTVALAPDDSVFVMNKISPRIQKIEQEKAISLLTSGFITVSRNIRRVLVEDTVDKDFYLGIFNFLLSSNFLDKEPILDFFPSSVNSKEGGGGRGVIEKWVPKMNEANFQLKGLVDRDQSPSTVSSIQSLYRYSMENYLLDPLIVFAVLIDNQQNISLPGINISFGDEHSLKILESSKLQIISDYICNQIETKLTIAIENKSTYEIQYVNCNPITVPNWLINTKGHDLMKQYCLHFNGAIINQANLINMFKKLRIIPKDFVTIFYNLQRNI